MAAFNQIIFLIESDTFKDLVTFASVLLNAEEGSLELNQTQIDNIFRLVFETHLTSLLEFEEVVEELKESIDEILPPGITEREVNI